MHKYTITIQAPGVHAKLHRALGATEFIAECNRLYIVDSKAVKRQCIQCRAKKIRLDRRYINHGSYKGCVLLLLSNVRSITQDRVVWP